MERFKQYLHNIPDVDRWYHGEPLIWWASYEGRVEHVKLLLRSGADINRRDVYGRTALHGASWSGKKDVVEVLLEYGADVSIKNNNGETARDDAIQNGKRTIVDMIDRHVNSRRFFNRFFS